ncbi:hypothetical protein SNEBB_008353 [Seison nebaliae]|nr:hypothetical protein SNEBB_008353 [Seison nebaliae]
MLFNTIFPIALFTDINKRRPSFICYGIVCILVIIYLLNLLQYVSMNYPFGGNFGTLHGVVGEEVGLVIIRQITFFIDLLMKGVMEDLLNNLNFGKQSLLLNEKPELFAELLFILTILFRVRSLPLWKQLMVSTFVILSFSTVMSCSVWRKEVGHQITANFPTSPLDMAQGTTLILFNFCGFDSFLNHAVELKTTWKKDIRRTFYWIIFLFGIIGVLSMIFSIYFDGNQLPAIHEKMLLPLSSSKRKVISFRVFLLIPIIISLVLGVTYWVNCMANFSFTIRAFNFHYFPISAFAIDTYTDPCIVAAYLIFMSPITIFVHYRALAAFVVVNLLFSTTCLALTAVVIRMQEYRPTNKCNGKCRLPIEVKKRIEYNEELINRSLNISESHDNTTSNNGKGETDPEQLMNDNNITVDLLETGLFKQPYETVDCKMDEMNQKYVVYLLIFVNVILISSTNCSFLTSYLGTNLFFVIMLVCALVIDLIIFTRIRYHTRFNCISFKYDKNGTFYLTVSLLILTINLVLINSINWQYLLFYFSWVMVMGIDVAVKLIREKRNKRKSIKSDGKQTVHNPFNNDRLLGRKVKSLNDLTVLKNLRNNNGQLVKIHQRTMSEVDVSILPEIQNEKINNNQEETIEIDETNTQL